MAVLMPDPDKIPDEQFEKLGVSREAFKRIRDVFVEREKTVPGPGTLAPDFEIERMSADGKRTGEMLRLSSMRGRPVGLIFGSYT